MLPKQTHPGCSSRSFKSYFGAAPPLERGIKGANALEAGSDGEHRNSPLERGASSTFFKGLEEAGCVARESAPGLDKMLNLVAFLPDNHIEDSPFSNCGNFFFNTRLVLSGSLTCLYLFLLYLRYS